MTLELVCGQTLSALLDTGTILPVSEAVDIVRRLAAQVVEMHVRGQIHRGIAPHAVTIDAESLPVLKAPDAAYLVGSPKLAREWLPPELAALQPIEIPADLHAAGEAFQNAGVPLDPREVDVYQLGALLCRLVTGESAERYRRSPRVKGRVPLEFRLPLERALGCDGRKRFLSAAEFLAALNGDSNGQIGGPGGAASAEDDVKADQSRTDTAVSFFSTAHERGDTSVGLGPQPVPRPADAPLPFTKLRHYEIVSRIGRGGMGEVYRAHEPALRRTVAIKVLPAELARQEDFIRRFHAEATAAAQLVHPNIVQIFYIGEDCGHHFFAMQFVEGESLEGLLAFRGRLSVEEALAIIEQALSGLSAAHELGLVHRDIKPGNILLDRRSRRALLADFGLVKSLESSAKGKTATGVVMGTMDYISPEQGRGLAVDARSDLYSVGVLLYRMLSGRLPFEADTPTALIFQHVYETPYPLLDAAPDTPLPLAKIVARLLEKSPAHRHQSADDVLLDLRAFRAGEPMPVDAARSAASSSLGPSSSRPRTELVRAPAFPELPLPTAESMAIRRPGWWERARDRALSVFRRHAPEMLLQLQNTQQQVDGAVAEYARRRQRLQDLSQEAAQVVAELRVEAEAQKSAADAARKQAESASDPASLEQFRLDQELSERAMGELARQIAEQEAQMESIDLRLAQVTATLQQLVSQRGIFNARLKAMGFFQRDSAARRRKSPIIGLGAAVLVAGIAGIALTTWLMPSGDNRPAEREEGPRPAIEPASRAEFPRAFLHFAKFDRVEVVRSAGVLDLNRDFTIELSARWPEGKQAQFIAADEVWAGMSPSLPVQATGGWALRYNARNLDSGLEFNIAEEATNDWFSVLCGPLEATTRWQHIAVSKTDDAIRVYVNGTKCGESDAAGAEFNSSPTNIFLGVPRFAFPNRNFNGDIRAFRISSTARYDENFTPPESFASDDETLILYVLREGDHELVVDLSGHAHEGLISGPKWMALEPTGGEAQP